MNNFKKFVAVLLGVVMACVFATSAFAASTSDKAAAIKSEIGWLVATRLPVRLGSVPASQAALILSATVCQ